MIDEYLSPSEKEMFKAEDGNHYAWGAIPGARNIPNWENMSKDDYILCVYGGVYHYVSKCAGKVHNELLAEAIWERDDNNKTWEYMYFFEKDINSNFFLYGFVINVVLFYFVVFFYRSSKL